MSWVALILAGCFEMIGVAGITMVNRKPSVRSFLVLVLGFVMSFVLLARAMDDIAMGTAYAVWTGIGTVGSAVTGMICFGEPKDWRRMCFILLIVASVIGLRLVE